MLSQSLKQIESVTRPAKHGLGTETVLLARYSYMSYEQTELYDKAVACQLTLEEANKQVVLLLQELRENSMAAHAASTY